MSERSLLFALMSRKLAARQWGEVLQISQQVAASTSDPFESLRILALPGELRMALRGPSPGKRRRTYHRKRRAL